MRKKILLIATLIILIAKYIEIMKNIVNYNTIFWALILALVSSVLILILSIKFMDKKWKFSSATLAILGILFIIVYYLNPNPISHFIWNFFIFSSLFLVFYSFSHYEIKKFPAFSYSFTLIYILTESISLWRHDTYAPFFLIYLTFILPMYIVGILKIKE